MKHVMYLFIYTHAHVEIYSKFTGQLTKQHRAQQYQIYNDEFQSLKTR